MRRDLFRQYPVLRRLGAPSRFAAVITQGIIVLGALFTLAANLPGQLSWDSVYALHQIHNNIPLTYDPPLMNALLRISQELLPGTALFVTFDVVLLFVALLVILRLEKEAPPWLPFAAIFVVASPLIVVTQGDVWHDVLFADLSVYGFALLIYAAEHWQTPKRRYVALLFSVAFLTLAAFARQNGVISLPIALAAIAIIERMRGDSQRFISTILSALTAVVFLIALNVAFSASHTNASYSSGIRLLQSSDIIGILSIDRTADLHPLTGANDRLARSIRRLAVRFSPRRPGDIDLYSKRLSAIFNGLPTNAIAAEWAFLLTHRPLIYLRERASIFRWTFLTPNIGECLPVFVGVGGKASWKKELGLPTRRRPQDLAIAGYAERFFTTPLFSHAFYALLAVIIIALLLLRRSRTDVAVIALLISSILVATSYFFISLACAFRYLYFLDLSALLGLLYFAVRPIAIATILPWRGMSPPSRRE